MKRSLAIRAWLACGVAAVCLAGAGIPAGAAEIDADALLRADENPNDWLMYHQSYKSWNYSALDQINANNVKDLKVVWMHTPGANKRGVQSVPIVVDGILYYTTSSSQIWALDGATGAFLWKFEPKIDKDRAEGTVYNPYNRGVAAALRQSLRRHRRRPPDRRRHEDRQTGLGQQADRRSTRATRAITGAPLIVKDKVIIGADGGEYSGCCGPIIAVDANTGKVVWQFDTVGGDERSRASWKNDSWKTGGGGGWMTGGYDPKTNTVFWGTANPAPDYDWSFDKCRPRPAPATTSTPPAWSRSTRTPAS